MELPFSSFHAFIILCLAFIIHILLFALLLALLVNPTAHHPIAHRHILAIKHTLQPHFVPIVSIQPCFRSTGSLHSTTFTLHTDRQTQLRLTIFPLSVLSVPFPSAPKAIKTNYFPSFLLPLLLFPFCFLFLCEKKGHLCFSFILSRYIYPLSSSLPPYSFNWSSQYLDLGTFLYPIPNTHCSHRFSAWRLRSIRNYTPQNLFPTGPLVTITTRPSPLICPQYQSQSSHR